MSESAPSVSAMLDGFRVAQAIHVACTLGLPDRVPAAGIDVAALAQDAGAHADALRRLLRALHTVGIFELHAGRCLHTDASRLLAAEHPSGLGDRAVGLGALAWASWGGLIDAVRTGEPSFSAVHGLPLFDYLQQHPDLAAVFGRTMSSWTRQTARAVLDAIDLRTYDHVVDIGGGHGIFLDAILASAPSLRATLVDRPEVVDAGAPALRASHRPRCALLARDVFADPLPAADAYILSWILHDWDDERCVGLLRACLEANPRADLIVVEMLLDDPSPAPAWFDLEMLVQTGGRERTRAEYAAIFEHAGWPPPRCIPTAGTHSVLRSTAV